MKRLIVAVVAMASGVVFSAPADGGMPVSKNIRGHENIGWEGGRSFHLTDGLKDLPRVFIVGDSISGQYRDFVKDALEGRVNVSWWSSSLCVTSPSYLRFIEIYLDATKYDVIHINNGLHSLDTPTGDYARELEAAFLLIRKKQPQAKIIWATSTPLKGGRTTACICGENTACIKFVHNWPAG